jgi:hypothetical protein
MLFHFDFGKNKEFPYVEGNAKILSLSERNLKTLQKHMAVSISGILPIAVNIDRVCITLANDIKYNQTLL